MNRLIERLIAKGITVTEYEDRGKVARHTWMEHFIPTERQKRNSLFLWEYIVEGTGGCLTGKAAEQALERVGKWRAVLFFQYTDDVLELDLTQAKSLTRKDLTVAAGDYADVYIVDPAYTWTFVVPHEADWGPYFLTKSALKGDD